MSKDCLRTLVQGMSKNTSQMQNTFIKIELYYSTMKRKRRERKELKASSISLSSTNVKSASWICRAVAHFFKVPRSYSLLKEALGKTYVFFVKHPFLPFPFLFWRVVSPKFTYMLPSLRAANISDIQFV